MKKHIISLFDLEHRRSTISFFITSVVLIIASVSAGINDNLPGLTMLFGGMIFLFFTIVHPWRDVSKYVILIGVCFGIILIILLGIGIFKEIHVNKTHDNFDSIVIGLFLLICLPGIVVGIIGAIICPFRNN